MKIMKRLSAVMLALTLGAGNITAYAEEKDFDVFIEEQVKQLLEEDYISLHFSVVDPESMGITVPEVTLGNDVSWESYDEEKQRMEGVLEQLHSFDRETLSDEQKNEYDTYEFYLKTMADLNAYPYFDFAFIASGGVLDAIQTNLSEFRFDKEQDFEDYLILVGEVDEYLEECMALTQTQAKDGYFLSNSQLQQTLDAIDSFLERTDDNALIISFNDAVDGFEGLDASYAQNLKDRNEELIINEVIPAYEDVRDGLEELEGSRNGGDSVYDLDGGKDYYQALASYKTGIDGDIQEMIDVCEKYMDRAMDEFIDLLSRKDSDFMYEYVEMDSAEEILNYLEENMKDLPEMENRDWTVDYLDPSIASDSVNAYYVTAPIDNMNINVMKVNGDNVSDTNSMYETLAHEGFPGHLYQTVTFSENDMAYVCGPIGYTEGWAMYAEMLGWSWSPLSEEAGSYNAVMTGINYVLDAVVDLGVNGLGWSVDDLADYLDGKGFNSAIAGSLYDFVAEQPGVILPYGVGLAEIMNMRYEAEEMLGSDFDLLSFNTVILEGGARPFSKVEEDFHAWLYEDGNAGTAVKKGNSSPWIIGGAVLVVIAGVVIVAVKKKGKEA